MISVYLNISLYELSYFFTRIDYFRLTYWLDCIDSVREKKNDYSSIALVMEVN